MGCGEARRGWRMTRERGWHDDGGGREGMEGRGGGGGYIRLLAHSGLLKCKFYASSMSTTRCKGEGRPCVKPVEGVWREEGGGGASLDQVLVRHSVTALAESAQSTESACVIFGGGGGGEEWIVGIIHTSKFDSIFSVRLYTTEGICTSEGSKVARRGGELKLRGGRGASDSDRASSTVLSDE